MALGAKIAQYLATLTDLKVLVLALLTIKIPPIKFHHVVINFNDKTNTHDELGHVILTSTIENPGVLAVFVSALIVKKSP